MPATRRTGGERQEKRQQSNALYGWISYDDQEEKSHRLFTSILTPLHGDTGTRAEVALRTAAYIFSRQEECQYASGYTAMLTTHLLTRLTETLSSLLL